MVITISSNGCYPFEAFHIPEKFALKAERELLETEENKSAALTQLREFVLSEKDLNCRTTDEFLLQFLRARKFNIPRAFSLLKKHVNFKRKNPNLFTDMNYEMMEKLVKSKTYNFLPERCEDGCAVLAIHLDKWNPSEVGIEHLKRSVVLFLYHSINDPLTQINGYKVLFDARSHPLKHLRYITPYNLYLLYSGAQECFPGRFKGIHIINMSITFKAAWAIIHPFLSEKLKKRIVFHDSNDTLLNYFPQSILPVDFGGQVKDCNTISWVKNAMQKENLERLAN